MKDITPAEKSHAIKISKALQLHFDQNLGITTMRSTDAYNVLVTKGLVERDRHQGIKFRNFLKRLNDANALGFIPQCKAQSGSGNMTNWIFRSESKLKIQPTSVMPVSNTEHLKADVIEAAGKIIATFPKREISDFDPIALETRKTYSRAYEYWTTEEKDLLSKTAVQITSSFELSKIFKRQPSAIDDQLNKG